MISAVICCRFVEFDTSVCNLPCVYALFGLISIASYVLSLQVFAFVEFLYSKSLQTSFIVSRVRVASVIPSAVTDLQY